MPFSPEVKSRALIRSARICCLCYKQCGTNIEIAHIIAEARGGSDADDNAIPLCFDCHQETGAYDDQHPRGNKFSPVELKARREQLYSLVGSGALQATIIAGSISRGSSAATLSLLPANELAKEIPAPIEPSKEAAAIVDLIASYRQSPEALPYKLDLLSERDRAFVLDRLVDRCLESSVMTALMALHSSGKLGYESVVVLEQVLRRVTLTGDPASKAAFMKLVAPDDLAVTDVGLRLAFFFEIAEIMLRDQFSEVNVITPAAIRVQHCIPKEVMPKYLAALLAQARSDAWQGGPAARTAVQELPEDLASETVATFDVGFLINNNKEYIRELIRRNERVWPSDKRQVLRDFLELDPASFLQKHTSIRTRPF